MGREAEKAGYIKAKGGERVEHTRRWEGNANEKEKTKQNKRKAVEKNG